VFFLFKNCDCLFAPPPPPPEGHPSLFSSTIAKKGQSGMLNPCQFTAKLPSNGEGVFGIL